MTLDSEHATTNHAAREDEPEQSPLALLGLDREQLGQLVRETWIAWANEQPTPKASWLISWNNLAEPDKEVDRRIGEAVARSVLGVSQVGTLAGVGQRCFVEGKGLGTIVLIWTAQGETKARIDMDNGTWAWLPVSQLTLLASSASVAEVAVSKGLVHHHRLGSNANSQEDVTPNAEKPFLGQRCHVEGIGFGTIIGLKFGSAGKVHAHVQCDAGITTWREVSKLELLAAIS